MIRPLAVTLEQAAALIGLPVPAFEAAVRSGEMPRPICVGTEWRWCVDDLEAAFQALPVRQAPTQHAAGPQALTRDDVLDIAAAMLIWVGPDVPKASSAHDTFLHWRDWIGRLDGLTRIINSAIAEYGGGKGGAGRGDAVADEKRPQSGIGRHDEDSVAGVTTATVAEGAGAVTAPAPDTLLPSLLAAIRALRAERSAAP